MRAELERRLEQAAALGLGRSLKPRMGADFCSNDYLGFAEDIELRARVQRACENEPLGAAGSRLIRGELEIYSRVEALLAEFSGKEAALIFPSGFQANLALLSALGREGDTFYSDERNHASLIDGMRLSRAERRLYRHLDMPALGRLLEEDRGKPGLKIIVSESLFSMDGDRAPLEKLCDLANAYGAALIVDEAHATGLWGSGLLEQAGLRDRVSASVHTGGKALGAAGAWVAGPRSLRDYLVNFSRPVIFSTGTLPALAVQLEQSVLYWREVGNGRALQLFEKCARLRRALGSETLGPIFPVLLGSNERALEAQGRLSSAGFDVRAIRPPTVAPGTARLRITLRSVTEDAEIDRLAEVLR
jgi:8-amino-7-oxononanoate synthase